ncbi:hypothetical protein BT63DRAFT_197817 [Microthyrium microscopicum]|uniref:DUF7730 domain-containing protein n=1 Tax=Microthyrium microscopicum TaxID=703497 RepID=A0A6A6ULX1_9PEZI|nr:hypothetical protein BT63DRAFT_197817 [Microthyrium microscopicum]
MSTFGFLRLPRELRDEMYRLALVSPKPLSIYNTTKYPSFCCCNTYLGSEFCPRFYGQDQKDVFTGHLHPALRQCQTKTSPRKKRACSLKLPLEASKEHPDYSPWYPNVALLSACRQLNSEAVPILYGENRFSFDERKLLVVEDNQYEYEFAVGPAYASATAICFDFLSSLAASTLPYIRKLSFYSLPRQWQHGRVFEFIARKTAVNDLELTFTAFRKHDNPWGLDVSTLPYSCEEN